MHKTYLFIAFITGFVLMVFEMVAARLMSPVVGGSTYIWASIIGVIIAAMSLGYFVGGYLADKRGHKQDVVWALCGTAVLVLLAIYQHAWLFEFSSSWQIDVRLQATLAATILFAPASFVLGAISPYLVKLQIQSLDTAGRSVASLSALNSIGGIIGTFMAGFFLFGWLGAKETLVILILLLVGSSWLLAPTKNWRMRAALSAACVVLAGLSVINTASPRHISVDTASAHYVIQEWQDNSYGPVRGILSGTGGIQSGMAVESPGALVFWYTSEMARLVEALPNKQNILVLGGGTFTLPRYLASAHPSSTIDVVEIDPGLLPVARHYFDYNDPSNVHIYFEDARTFMSRSDKTYDIILVDVYNDAEVPFSLVTEEYAEALRQRLQPNSIVVVNMITSRQPGCLPLFAALDAPYRSIFGEGRFLYRIPEGRQFSNLLAVYTSDGASLPDVYQPYTFDEQVLYTDNYAPVERLHQTCVDENSTTNL